MVLFSHMYTCLLYTSTWERVFYMATLKNVYQAPVINEFRKYVIEHADL